jgi:hypothetical protein
MFSKYCDKKNVICHDWCCEYGTEIMDYSISFRNGNEYVTQINGRHRGLAEAIMNMYDQTRIHISDIRVVESCEDVEAQIREENIQKELEEQKRQETEKRKMLPLAEIPTSECTCDKCNGFCTYRTCWGTPDDIKKIIDAGYADRLMLDWWQGYELEILVIVPALEGCEGSVAPFDPRGRCTFFKDERCEIHSIKPIEGKISHHSGTSDYNIHEKIVELWDTYEGRSVVEKWRTITGCRDDPVEGSMFDNIGLMF